MKTPRRGGEHRSEAHRDSELVRGWYERSLVMRYLAVLTGSRPRPVSRSDARRA
jgi:hypothetical protein